MRHRMRGRKLGRSPSHRRAMFRNMACSLIRSVRVDEDDKQKPKVPGRIVTTVAKAKELRPIVEKLVTLARQAIPHEEAAQQYASDSKKNSAEWKSWRDSEQWNQWNQAVAPAVALRRRAFARLRDNQAVDILFDELAERFEDRPGGYTRVVRLSTVRLGDGGQQALIEFVGERDRARRAKRKAPVVADDGEREETRAAAQTSEVDESANSAAESEPEAASEAAADEAASGGQKNE